MTDCRKPSGGWCGRDFKPRLFPERDVVICYDKCPAALVDRAEYDRKRREALLGSVVTTVTVPKKSARTWKMLKGDLCRITVIEGPQVGDLNFWNLQNSKERFYSGKTRQLHSAHLNVYDRLWSNFPYLRPMATFVADSIKYGIDQDGAGVHDVIGTRCDDYTYKLIRGEDRVGSCHSALTAAAKEAGLTEDDVHDVWNIFMCTGFTKIRETLLPAPEIAISQVKTQRELSSYIEAGTTVTIASHLKYQINYRALKAAIVSKADTHQYFCKGSPAQKGDYIEFIADMDLLVGLSACPQGDVSIPVGKEVPDSKCFPLQVEVFRAK